MQFRRAERLLRTLAVLSLVLPVAIFAGFAWLSHGDYVAAARDQISDRVELVREHAVKVLEVQELVVQLIETSVAGRSDDAIRTDEAAINTLLKSITARYIQVQDIILIDRNGRLLVTAATFPAPPQIDVTDREYFRRFRDAPSDGIYITENLLNRLFNRPTFQIAKMRQAPGTGAFDGVILIVLGPNYFHEIYSQFAGDTFATVGLVRDDGRILARYPDSGVPLDQVPPTLSLVEAIKRNPEIGTYDVTSVVDGNIRRVGYQRVGSYPVYATVTMAATSIRDTWLMGISRHLVFGLPASIAFFVLILVALALVRRGTATYDALRLETTRRAAAEEQLRQAQKMEAVGQLTGGIAHDFNNLLTIIFGNLERVKRLTGNADRRVSDSVDSALEGAARAAKLTQRLLAFSRQQPLEPAAIEANRLVSGMSEMLRRTLGENIAVETVLAGGLWRTFVDPHQLESAILNLAVNARDAMPDGGRITIETANAHLDENYAAANSGVKPGQYVLIAVTDTGTGMTAEIMARAFEPFFTNKPTGLGTGLGLSQVHGFIKQSGGHVALYSELGHGTTVRLYLPRSMAEIAAPVAALAADSAKSGAGQTILVVEDEHLVRNLSATILREAGYRVLVAEDGPRALELLASAPETRLLFTDVVLAGPMNGRKVADAALALRPDLKVLFTTGYTRNAIVHHGVLDADVNFIGKPFSGDALLKKVEALLSE